MYSKYREAPGLALLPTTEEGRELLGAIVSLGEAKSLPEPKEPALAEEAPDCRPGVEQVREVLQRVTGVPGPPPSEKPKPETDIIVFADPSRVEEQKRRLQEHLAAHPLTRAEAVETGGVPR